MNYVNNPPFNFEQWALWTRRIEAGNDLENCIAVLHNCPTPIPQDHAGNVIESESPIINKQLCFFHPIHAVLVKVHKMMPAISRRENAVQEAMDSLYPGVPFILEEDLERSILKGFQAACSRVTSRRDTQGVLPSFGSWIKIPVPAKETASCR